MPPAAMMGGAGGPPPVEVQAVTEEEVNLPNTYIGRVEPIQDVELRAQVSGYIKNIHFKEGADVKAGDLLFTIDPEQYEARVAVRKAEIEQAEALLDRMLAWNLELVRRLAAGHLRRQVAGLTGRDSKP